MYIVITDVADYWKATDKADVDLHTGHILQSPFSLQKDVN